MTSKQECPGVSVEGLDLSKFLVRNAPFLRCIFREKGKEPQEAQEAQEKPRS
jgi:hypothetical protein